MDVRSRGSVSGFTLIELLIVVAIVGILVGIAIPQLVQYRQKSYNSNAKADLHLIRMDLEIFYQEHAYYPY